jgi:hypothetical protein
MQVVLTPVLTTKQRIGNVISWWCNGLLAVYTVLVVIGFAMSTEPGAMTFFAVLLGIPVVLIFLVGRSLRYILR